MQEQNAKLRAIIIKGSNTDNEPLDTIVIRLFCDLRDLVRKIVHKHYRMDGTIHLEDKSCNTYFESQIKFFQRFQPDQPDSIRKYRTRAKIFDFVFAAFEVALTFCEKGNMDIIEWRRRTAECAKWLDCEFRQSQRPKDTSGLIHKYMEPLLAPVHPTASGTLASSNMYTNSMDEVCTNAYKLALLLRTSKAMSGCDVLREGAVIDEAMLTEISVQAYEGAQAANLLGSEIAITVFGSLVKSLKGSLDEWYILEKAHVVCRV
ncbi:hypothetical protein MMC17_009284 [Xylographa soralifera]|nr:hypothetical protein [Xylographa soralifera]